MKRSMKYLRRFICALVYLLPATLYCSYYPILKLGETSSMNLELSLPLIWLVIFDLTTFVVLLLVVLGNRFCHFSEPSREEQAATTERGPRKDGRPNGAKKSWQKLLPGISDRKFFLFSLFPFFATLSIFWSSNPTRALLTAGIIWLVFFAIFALIYVLPLLKLPGNFRRNCLRSFFIASALICVVCWVQCFLDLAGLSRETTLMCPGCTYLSFGFPHPSGFAIEPQFMGNLLLAPTLTSLYLLIFQQRGKNEPRRYNTNHSKLSRKQARKSEMQKSNADAFEESPELTSEDEDAAHPRRRAERTSCPKKHQHWTLVLFTSLFSSTLFLTFSRGAIYAYAAALIILFIFALRRHVLRASLILIPVVTFGFIVAIQGLFTVIGPTHGTFIGGVSRSIHQLSLGVIDFRPKNPSESAPETSETPSDSIPSSDQALAETTPSASADEQPQPFFEGYVAESTNARLNLNSVALKTWSQSPGIILFGVGLGGAGTSMHRFDPNRIGSPKEIVQHQGISLLLELGLVGTALILLIFYLAFFSRGTRAVFWHQPALPLFISLIAAYLVTLNFFAGLPNALQIYLILPLLYFIFEKTLAFHKNA